MYLGRLRIPEMARFHVGTDSLLSGTNPLGGESDQRLCASITYDSLHIPSNYQTFVACN